MKIIKHGTPKYNNPDRKFKCGYCGCVFEAEHGEYQEGMNEYNKGYYFSVCPECGRLANEVVMLD